MMPTLGKCEYLVVNLSKGGTKKQFPVHKLVAQYFVSNPENKQEIHHIDFNKFNNRYDNLKPVTRGEHRKLEREHAMNILGIEPPIDEPEDVELITLINGKPYVRSIDVARDFGKEHKNVLVVIGDTLKTLFEVAVGDSELNFKPAKNTLTEIAEAFIKSEYKDEQGKPRPMYYLNRDAFALVVMGFTGKKAALWKWNYIQEFNRMEKELKSPQPKQNDNPDYIPRKVKLLKELIDITDNPDLRDKLIEKVLNFV